jgi:DNA invertase Pin-like site-specific DNA recombinase
MAGQRIGYVRVSTFDQNPERQLDMKQMVLLNVDIIVHGWAGMPIDCDITLAA